MVGVSGGWEWWVGVVGVSGGRAAVGNAKYPLGEPFAFRAHIVDDDTDLEDEIADELLNLGALWGW